MISFHQARRVAAFLQEHFGTLAADSGFRSTFREEHKYEQGGNSFSREDVMDHDWHLRMAKHAQINRTFERIEPTERATLYHAFSTERWPEPLQTIFWSSYVNACLAGVVIAHPFTVGAAKASSSKSPGAWLRKAIRMKQLGSGPPMQFLLKQAERETCIALEAFDDAWKETENK